MQVQLSIGRVFRVIVSCIIVLFLTSACATTVTTQSKTGAIERAQGETSPVVRSGFLGDYSQLKPGAKDQAAMVYVNPHARWSTYHSIIVKPVEFWSSDNTVPISDQKVLTSYFYNALRNNLQNYFTLVDKPGPGVMELKAAITDVKPSTPVLRSVSVIIPQARLLNQAQSLATGSYAFVGSAQAEGQIVDSMTGTRLAAAIDKREGGMSVKAAAQWKWGDAQNALDYWAEKLPDRIVKLQERGGASD